MLELGVLVGSGWKGWVLVKDWKGEPGGAVEGAVV